LNETGPSRVNVPVASTVDAPQGKAEGRLARWLQNHRGSSRLAFLLHLVIRILGAGMALVWARLILRAMGEQLNGLFVAFQAAAQLGGLGDLGMGGTVAIKAGQYLGNNQSRPLQDFLASARTVFLLMALVAGGVFVAFSPWLPTWLHLKTEPGAGSLSMLCAVASVAVATLVLCSYVKNLNYACGTVLWPVVPSFLLLQAYMCSHWLLARRGPPLWVQYIPYSVAGIVDLALACLYLRAGFPGLARVFPLRFELKPAMLLFEGSFWMYLIGLGYNVFTSCDRLVIEAFFGSTQVVIFHYNYRPCELAMTLIFTAGLVTVPKLTQWLAASGPEARARAISGLERLNQFQTMLGCAAALAYLLADDFFITVWLGKDMHMQAPLLLQAAFALNLAINTGRDAGLQAAMRCGDNGVRVVGTLVASGAAINLGLALLAGKMGSIPGIAMAAGIGQSFLGLGTGLYYCRRLELAWLPWAIKSWFVPVAAVGLAASARWFIHPNSTINILALVGGYLLLLLVVAWVQGVRPALLKEEFNIVRSFLRRG
jgi:O-antigen/teichoic acid export membrane protein